MARLARSRPGVGLRFDVPGQGSPAAQAATKVGADVPVAVRLMIAAAPLATPGRATVRVSPGPNAAPVRVSSTRVGVAIVWPGAHGGGGGGGFGGVVPGTVVVVVVVVVVGTGGPVGRASAGRVGGLVPAALIARTRNRWTTPLVRPVAASAVSVDPVSDTTSDQVVPSVDTSTR